ncbi:type II secretion system secretin GspD [Usitatibacter palustris]|uniref:type II secretion system secretin GspD n=1 Tax=Usitatibacter palustris TaxID=2732487 RepID=UPI0014880884|nr:type II secretion system secretin GspD [Usitatibacter palustris]
MTRFLGFPAAFFAAALTALSFLALAAEEEKITLNFVNADIQSVIKTVGQHTGKNFILDPRVTGTVNIVSDKPVSKDMLYTILLSTLRVQGYAAVEGDGFVKIVPEAEAKTSSSPTGEAALKVPGDRIVTQVFLLQNESAVQLVPVLRPLVTANNFIAAYPNNNAIVITDYAENVRRIQRIIASIDLPSGGDVQIIRLQNASAIDIIQTLQKVVPETNAPANAPGAAPKVAIALDQRTNSLIVRADSPALMNRVKALAVGLDTAGAASGNIYVVYLRNAEATRIAETLRGLLQGADAARGAQPASTSATTASNSGANTNTTSSSTSTSQPVSNPSSVIQAYPPTNSIIITAPEPVYRSLRAVIDKLDTRRAQVYIEALIVEISTGKAQELGVQWAGGKNVGDGRSAFAGTNFSTGGVGSNIISAATDPRLLGGGLNLGLIDGTLRIPGTDIEILNLQVLARALEADSGANVLSTPNMLTLDNEEARIVVGQNVPFITGSYTPTSGSATNPFQTIERKDIGITLRVTPQVSEGGGVKLKIFQEISSVTRDAQLIRSADIITNKRSLESTVLVDHNQIAVLGGLIQDDQGVTIDKVPVLGDIPYLGTLFKYESRNRKRTNLMVFLRPVVIKDDKASASLTADRYEYIRNLQQNMVLPRNFLLPEEPAKVLPPIEDAKVLGK